MADLYKKQDRLHIVLLAVLLAIVSVLTVFVPWLWLIGGLAAIFFLWLAFSNPVFTLLLLVFGAQYAPLLAKILENKIPYYVAVVAPLPVAMAVVWAKWRKDGRVLLDISAIRGAVLLLFGTFVVQLFNPWIPSLEGALSDLVRIFAPMGVFFACAVTDLNDRWLRGLFVVVAVNTFVAAAYGVSQAFLGWLPFEQAWARSIGAHGFVPGLDLQRRPPSVTFYSATAAIYLSTLFWLLVGLGTRETRLSRYRLPFYALLGLTVFAIVLTLTRGIWLAFGLSLALGGGIGFLRWWRAVGSKLDINWYPIGIFLLVIVVILGASTAYFVDTQPSLLRESGGVAARFASILDWRTYAYAGTAVGSRLTTWKRFLSSIGAWEFLSGYGLGNFGAAGARFAAQRSFSQTTVDNFYITTLLTGGLLSLLALWWLLWRSLRTGLQIALDATDRKRWVMGMAMACVIALFGFAFLTGDYLDAYPANLFFWLCLGLLDRLAKERVLCDGI